MTYKETSRRPASGRSPVIGANLGEKVSKADPRGNYLPCECRKSPSNASKRRNFARIPPAGIRHVIPPKSMWVTHSTKWRGLYADLLRNGNVVCVINEHSMSRLRRCLLSQADFSQTSPDAALASRSKPVRPISASWLMIAIATTKANATWKSDLE